MAGQNRKDQKLSMIVNERSRGDEVDLVGSKAVNDGYADRGEIVRTH